MGLLNNPTRRLLQVDCFAITLAAVLELSSPT
ncbi:unnamed protein product [Linum tenue]|uniref:Uncharacterized protein n=1 Tax=Linum tenue TaxID=586396 RepID=A0AAV0QJ93_9ROSI|nr:unnamed protein product [Linum tenue]